VKFIALSSVFFSFLLISCSQQPQALWLKPGAAPDDFNQERYACLQQSQQPNSTAYLNRYGGAANSSIITNDGLYSACMSSRGWALTPLTDLKAYNEAMRAVFEDQRAFCSRNDLQVIWKKMGRKVTDTTPEQLADRSKISNEQKPAFSQWQQFVQDTNEKMGAIYVQYDTKHGRAVASAFQDSAADLIRLASEHANGGMTWGEFSKRRLELYKKAQESQKIALNS